MNKQALSVTLSPDNLLWLQGQARLRGARSLSAALDQVLSEARATPRHEIRSVVGSVSIDPSDPELRGANAAVRDLFSSSLARTGARRGAVRRRG
jgi:hypothetical protein